MTEKDCEEFTAATFKLAWLVSMLFTLVHDMKEGIDYWFVCGSVLLGRAFGWLGVLLTGET